MAKKTSNLVFFSECLDYVPEISINYFINDRITNRERFDSLPPCVPRGCRFVLDGLKLRINLVAYIYTEADIRNAVNMAILVDRQTHGKK